MLLKNKLRTNFYSQVESFNFADYQMTSRLHKLNTQVNLESNIYVKRDDELGFGVSGSKIRKYLSLIPYLKQNNFDEVIILGGLNSNNVLSAIQLLIEKNIKPIIFLSNKIKQDSLIGNAFFTSLFLNETNIIYTNNKEEEILNYQKNMLKKGKKVFILPEGANTAESLPGSLTLPYDILKNEDKYNINFQHIFIDSGTGLMAISIIIAFLYIKKDTLVHVLLIAGTEPYFKELLNYYLKIFNNLFQQNITLNSNFILYTPTNAKSFGSTNSKIFEFITKNCRHNGFLLDPIYSGKLFYESFKIINEKKLKENILIIHSGGSLTLTGFQNKLLKNIKL
ncbi:pyridoxal-phosphate dependent enzyme [Pigmentibacter ruber]